MNDNDITFKDLIGTLDQDRANYLKELGFWEGNLKLLYDEPDAIKLLTEGEPCYILNTDIGDFKRLTVQISKYDIYYVYQHNYGSLIDYGIYDSTEYDTVEELEELLDEIANKITWY